MGSEYLITHTSTTHDHKSINILPGILLPDLHTNFPYKSPHKPPHKSPIYTPPHNPATQISPHKSPHTNLSHNPDIMTLFLSPSHAHRLLQHWIIPTLFPPPFSPSRSHLLLWILHTGLKHEPFHEDLATRTKVSPPPPPPPPPL